MEDVTNCYGHYSESSRKCKIKICRYAASCRYFTETEPRIDSGLHMTSFEEISEWEQNAADFDHIPGREVIPDENHLPDALGRIVKFLLTLDDIEVYSLGLPGDDFLDRCRRRHLPLSDDDRKIVYAIKQDQVLSSMFTEVAVKILDAHWNTTSRRNKKSKRRCTDVPVSKSFFDVVFYFFDYILALDDLTVGIIVEIIDPHTTPCVVSTIGKALGCSRQNIHRKICTIIGDHPELSAIFLPVLYKLPDDKQLQLRRKAG